MITIRKTETGFIWQPNNGKQYPISFEQFIQSRIKKQLLNLEEGEELKFANFEYTKDKILMVW